MILFLSLQQTSAQETWNEPEEIPLYYNNQHALMPEVTSDNENRIHLIYTQKQNFETDLQTVIYQHYKEGKWSEPQKISMDGGRCTASDIAVDNESGIVGVLYTCGKTRTFAQADILYIYSEDGGNSWSEPEIIPHRPGQSSSLEPRFVYVNGEPNIVFTRDSETGDVLYDIRYTRREGSKWSELQTLSDHGYHKAISLKKTCTDDPFLHVVYQGDGRAEGKNIGGALYYNRKRVDQEEWEPYKLLDNKPFARPFLAVGEEKLYVVWQKQLGREEQSEYWEIVFKYSEDNGETWLPEKPINLSKKKGLDRNPLISVSQTGKILVTWVLLKVGGYKNNTYWYATADESEETWEPGQQLGTEIGEYNALLACENGFQLFYETNQNPDKLFKLYRTSYGNTESCTPQCKEENSNCSAEHLKGKINGSLIIPSKSQQLKQISLLYDQERTIDSITTIENGILEKETCTQTKENKREKKESFIACCPLENDQILCTYTLSLLNSSAFLRDKLETLPEIEPVYTSQIVSPLSPVSTPTISDINQKLPKKGLFLPNLSILLHFETTDTNTTTYLKKLEKRADACKKNSVETISVEFKTTLSGYVFQEKSDGTSMSIVATITIHQKEKKPGEEIQEGSKKAFEGQTINLEEGEKKLTNSVISPFSTGPFGYFTYTLPSHSTYNITVTADGFPPITKEFETTGEPLLGIFKFCEVANPTCKEEFQIYTENEFRRLPIKKKDFNFIKTLLNENLHIEKTPWINYINFLLTWLYTIAGSIGIVFLMVTGFSFIVSNDTPTQRQQNKQRLTSILIGCVIVFSSWLILNFVGKTFGINLVEWSPPVSTEEKKEE